MIDQDHKYDGGTGGAEMASGGTDVNQRTGRQKEDLPKKEKGLEIS